MAVVSFVYRWCDIKAHQSETSPHFNVPLPQCTHDPSKKPECWLFLRENLVSLGYRGKASTSSYSPPTTIQCTFRAIDCAGKTLAVSEVVESRVRWYANIEGRFPKSEFALLLQDNSSFSIEVSASIASSASCADCPVASVRVGTGNAMTQLWNNKLFADVTIKCGDESFSAHKAILASRSPVFRKMFEADMKEKSSNVIEIVDMDPPVMSDLLTYLYTGTAPNLIMKETAEEFFNAANKYEIPGLLDRCDIQLCAELKYTNVLDMLVFANLHGLSYLKEACFCYIKSYSGTLFKSDEWKFFFSNCDRTLLHEIFMKV